MRSNNLKLVVAIALVIGSIAPVYAAKRGGGSGNANQAAMMKAQQMIQQYKAEADKANAELAKMRTENEDLAKQNEKLEKKLKKKQKELNYTSGSLDNYKEGYEKLTDRLVATQEKMQELIGKFRATIKTLRQTEVEKNTALNDLDNTEDKLLVCANNNVKLYDTNLELLSQYEEKGVWSALKQQEPITQLSQVQIENMIQQYRDIIDELKVEVVAQHEQ
ncbi:MAG: hypothetical protein D6B28_06965 [Gammaproteobacteria bacterium]|nr:MAG: hypothetical protein D6B28_06965 [Gammaproteobacteria bacterium]